MLDAVANPRVHATTQRVVKEAFAEEKSALKPLPLAPYRTVLKLERQVMASIGGNLYSVPNTTRRQAGALIASRGRSKGATRGVSTRPSYALARAALSEMAWAHAIKIRPRRTVDPVRPIISPPKPQFEADALPSSA